MINQIQLEWLQNYYNVPSIRLDRYPFMAHAGGISIICIELFFPFLVLSKRLRWSAVVFGLSIHQLAGYFMHISMADLQFIYISFINVSFFSRKNKALEESNPVEIKEKPEWSSKVSLCIGIVLFSLNFLFGFFHIESWPFSCYPSHSSNVSNSFRRIEFELENVKLGMLSIDSIGKKNNFRKDNYYPVSYQIIAAYERNDTIATKQFIGILWKNWQINNPELAPYNNPKVFIVETPVSPERRNEFIKQEEIFY